METKSKIICFLLCPCVKIKSVVVCVFVCEFLIKLVFFLDKIQMLMNMYSTPAFTSVSITSSDCQILMKFPVCVESTVLDEKFHGIKDEQMVEHLDGKRK